MRPEIQESRQRLEKRRNFMLSKLEHILFAAGIALTISLSTANAASTEKTAFSFNGANGSGPNGSVVFDKAGNLYGTTSDGGTYGYGTVYKLSPSANGNWTETILHDFNGIPDGANPSAALIWDTTGNLYGTATAFGPYGNDGSVFELSPAADGTWTFKVLSGFDGYDGFTPIGSLAFDAQGNLYGTTWEGGIFSETCLYGCGTVYKVTPGSNGEWTTSAIFKFNGVDGSSPYSNVIFDAQGNLYGTSSGAWNPKGYIGTVYELIPGANGEWTEKTLATFPQLVTAGLIFDKAGNLYGTTWDAGANFLGSVFELSPNGDGTWTETTLHSFNGKDGSWVYAGVVFDSKGNLWGTTSGYSTDDLGSVYELLPNGKGQWAINVIHTFSDDQVDGGVTFDSKGNIYSTAPFGGKNSCQGGCGFVFEVTP
jgi:uncharacterized repeat protein (TIGR03803 family)